MTAEDGTTTLVEARHAVVVSTGSAPVVPPVPGLREAEPWSSEDATASHDVPGSLAVIGGGVVGVEMATAYAALGSTVTVLSRLVRSSAAPSRGPARQWAMPWAPPASRW